MIGVRSLGKLGLDIWDSAGNTEYINSSKFQYYEFIDTSVFILCYSVNNRNSLHNLKDIWIKKALYTSPTAPFIVVGTKLDLADAPMAVSLQEGRIFSKNINSYDHTQCSARNYINLNDGGVNLAFKLAISAAIKLKSLNKRSTKICNCTLL